MGFLGRGLLTAVFCAALVSGCSDKETWTVTCPWAPSGIAALISQKTASLSGQQDADLLLVAEAVKGDAATVNNWVMHTGDKDPSLVLAGEGMFAITQEIDPSKLKFKFEDFAYIANLYSAVFVLTASSKLEISDFQGLADYIKDSDQPLSIAVNGATSSEAFLAAALFSSLGGASRIRLTPYSSAAEAAQAAARGETMFAVCHQSQALEPLEQGLIKALAVFDERSPQQGPFAGVSAVGELGYPYFKNCCFVLAKEGADPKKLEAVKGLYEKILGSPELKEWVEETMLVSIDPLSETEVIEHISRVQEIVRRYKTLVM